MNVLITGGTGFLGKQLALTLQACGDKVTVTGRNAVIGAQLEAVGLRFVQADLRDEEAIAAVCAGQDCVFHCGAFSSPWGNAQTFYDVNVLGTRHVVQGCLTHGVHRLVHVSTSAVYFAYTDQRQIPESQPFPPPVNAYAKTKQLAEKEIVKGHQQGLSTLVIRPRGIFGPGDTALLPRLLKASDRTGIPLIRQGRAMVDITYVDNVVTALRLAQEAPDVLSGRAYNITNAEPKPLIELLQAVSEQLGCGLKFKSLPFPVAYSIATAMEGAAKLFSLSEPPLTRYTVGLMAFSQTLCIDAAIADLKYSPQVTLAAGIAKFSHWWKQQDDIR
ncbi:MAG: NAD-dependent epimerase/dehydratase family protein [Pseudomonadota bacterium]